MTVKQFQIRSNVRLHLVQTGRFKTGCFSFNILRPLSEQTAAVNALIPSVLLRGCEKYPDMQKISHRLDELFGASIGSLVRKKGEVQAVGLYADFLEDRYADAEPVFEKIMEFLRELIFAPCLEDGGFVDDYTQGEKANLINTISSRINDKRSYATFRLLKNMCPTEAFCVTRLGEKEVLETVTGKSLYQTWQELLATSRIELFYLGQKSEEEVLKEVELLAERLPVCGEPVSVKTVIGALPSAPKTVEEALDITQGKLAIGFRTPVVQGHPLCAAMTLLNAVYGAGMTSKLFTKIREEQSLCYYASSSYDRHKGVVIVSSGIEFDKFQVARDGILHQLDLCKSGDITDEEIESARSFLISILRACNDNPGQLDDFMITQAIANSDDTVERRIEQIAAVTKQQLIEAANTLVLDTVYFLKGDQKA